MWSELAEMIGDDELAEKIRRKFANERIKVPGKPIKRHIVLIVKQELKTKSYSEVAKKHNLSEMTVRNYESWKISEERLISPSGREYQISKRSTKD